MLNYNLLLILSIVFIFGNNPKESVLLFHLDSSVNSLEIFDNSDNLVDHIFLNEFLLDNNAYKIEKWNRFASETDIYDGIKFSQIYRVYFNNKSILITDIKGGLEKLGCIDAVEFDYDRKPYYTPNDPRYNNQWVFI